MEDSRNLLDIGNRARKEGKKAAPGVRVGSAGLLSKASLTGDLSWKRA